MNKKTNSDYISKAEVNEMIEDALRRHNRRSTIISSILGWILLCGLKNILNNKSSTKNK